MRFLLVWYALMTDWQGQPSFTPYNDTGRTVSREGDKP
jgi:hypothetical protein